MDIRPAAYPNQYGLPKLSIIIASYNECEALKHTLTNLAQQQYPLLEVVVIDGDSSDGTKALLQNPPLPVKWLSEPDGGISDAFNKGVRLATGEYLNFQGAGDGFTAPDILSRLFQDILGRPALVCGRVQRLSEDGHQALWQAPKRWPKHFNKVAFLFRMALPHQGLFTHQGFFYKYGLFDTQCKFAMDYELLLRAYHQFPEVVCSNLCVAHWRAGGVGTNRLHDIFDEYHRIKCQHSVAPRWMLESIDKWTRAKQGVKTVLGRV